MQSMNEDGRRVIDAHADTHHAAALDERGGLLGIESFAASVAGYRELLGWLRSFGEIDRVGVESTGSYAAALTRYLVAEDVRVLEVNQPHPHTRRQAREDRRDRRGDGRPSRPQRREHRHAETDHRGRRSDPSDPRRARQRGQITVDCDVATR